MGKTVYTQCKGKGKQQLMILDMKLQCILIIIHAALYKISNNYVYKSHWNYFALCGILQTVHNKYTCMLLFTMLSYIIIIKETVSQELYHGLDIQH